MIVNITVDSTLRLKDKKLAYTICFPHSIDRDRVLRIAQLLSNGVTDKSYAFVYEDHVYAPNVPGYRNVISAQPYDLFDIFEAEHLVEVAYLPGTTDNVGNTAAQIIMDVLDIEGVTAHTSEISFFETSTNAHVSYNPLIKYCKSVTRQPCGKLFEVKFTGNRSVGARVSVANPCQTPHPISHLTPKLVGATLVESDDICSVNLNIDDSELLKISKLGIKNRGALNLSLASMHAIRDYFRKEDRNPTDLELETFAQTWSEHCKHNIFSSPIDEITDGLYGHYIKRATTEINSPICVLAFSDNAGAIVFDDDFLIVDKVETHNSPSALDPFGGAETGILGVNRDIIGFGMGAKPILNSYYFCFSEPLEKPLYRDKECTEPILSPSQVMDGVIMGVNSGGNRSGIPTALGSMYFHSSFCGKPLVFVGSTGIIPKKIGEKPSHKKTAHCGDYIVVIGGRVGKDGIHGATFSSNALEDSADSTVVQIGSPITQKKLSDAIIKEARDLCLYNAITDNGAGGLSSSVGEMGEKGFVVELSKVPLKTDRIMPWEVWISESQERMTLSVPPDKYPALEAIMRKHDVEISIIGEFNQTGRAVVSYNGTTIMDVDTNFLHNGCPKLALHTEPWSPRYVSTTTELSDTSIEEDLLEMMGRKNVFSREFLASQYDHEVQGSSVIKPIQGKGKITVDAVVMRPILSSKRGIVKSQGFGSVYGEIDPYCMAACAIDTAIRNYVSVGGNVDHLALIDNFCWCNATNPQRLWQLKRAAQACYDYAVKFRAPFISGKDSMFNDFYGYDINGNDVHVSALPSLLISTLGIIDNIENAVSQHVKGPSLIYVLGTTFNELGMSEYQLYSGRGNNQVPQVHAEHALALYRKLNCATNMGIVDSAIPLGIGGLATSLIKSLIGGNMGAEINLAAVPAHGIQQDDDWARTVLFSESQSRMLVTVSPRKQQEFEQIFSGTPYGLIGKTVEEYTLTITGIGKVSMDDLEARYKKFSNSYYACVM